MLKGKKTVGVIAFITAALWFGLVPEAEGVTAVTPDGPYPVGVKIERMSYQGQERLLMAWYPAQAQPGAESYRYQTKILGSAVFDAPVEKKEAPYPLLIFSHGLGACGCQSVFYTENLASFGYVVVAMDHDDSTMCHIEGESDVSYLGLVWAFIKSLGNLEKMVKALFGEHLTKIGFDLSYRSAEAKAVIDQALDWNQDPASFLYGMMDPDRIGATGHSLGGYTSLMVGGVPFRCDEKQPDPEVCNTDSFDNLDLRRMNPCCLDVMREMEDPFQLRDERVKAILPLGPAVIFPNLERAAAEIEIPIMIISTDSKRMEVPWEPIWTIYTNAPPPKYAIRLRESDHMTIADVTLGISLSRFFFPGFRSNFGAKAQAYKDSSVAFFDLYLKGDDSRAAVLQKPSNRFVELWFETE